MMYAQNHKALFLVLCYITEISMHGKETIDCVVRRMPSASVYLAWLDDVV